MSQTYGYFENNIQLSYIRKLLIFAHFLRIDGIPKTWFPMSNVGNRNSKKCIQRNLLFEKKAYLFTFHKLFVICFCSQNTCLHRSCWTGIHEKNIIFTKSRKLPEILYIIEIAVCIYIMSCENKNMFLYRCKYQGLSPPEGEMRGDVFLAGTKFQVSSDTPNIR